LFCFAFLKLPFEQLRSLFFLFLFDFDPFYFAL